MSPGERAATLRMSRPADGVALVEIDRPRARNALDVATVAALGAGLSALDAEPGIRAIVLAGAGGDLSAGSDIKEMQRLGLSCLRDPARMRGWAEAESVTKPMIAAVDGLALGAGLELALLADWIVAGPKARMGLPELSLGLMAGDGATQRLARAIGQPAALRMILTGAPVGADEAGRLGLAMLAPDGALDAAIAQAARIAGLAPLAARLAKQTVRAGLDGSLSSGLKLEARALEVLFSTDDCREGLAAFVEKRPPQFKGS